MKNDPYQDKALAFYKKLQEEIAGDKFLLQWLADSEEGRKEAAADESSQDEKELRARQLGYRSHRIATEHWANSHSVLKSFLDEAAFKSLWKILKEADKKSGELSFSPSHFGFPGKVLKALEDWYREPKLTVAERKLHHKKIEKACDDLLDLLEPVIYGATLDTRFRKFSGTDPVYPELLKWFESPKDWFTHLKGADRIASAALTGAGLTPTWAIRSIKSSATDTGQYIELPTKVRAKGAMKTFLIQRLWSDLEAMSAFMMTPISVSYELFSEIIGLISNRDCTADDVRKVLGS